MINEIGLEMMLGQYIGGRSESFAVGAPHIYTEYTLSSSVKFAVVSKYTP